MAYFSLTVSVSDFLGWVLSEDDQDNSIIERLLKRVKYGVIIGLEITAQAFSCAANLQLGKP